MTMKANQVLDRCDSTSDLARELGEAGYPHGTWISARAQEAGRGRMGRKWESLSGNLFLSMIARIDDRGLWTWVPLSTAIAVTRALNDLCEIRIKWPNDLWARGGKLGGILCEAVTGRGGAFIVIGLGLNCARAPEALDQPTMSLTEAAGSRVSAEDIRMKIVAELHSTLDRLCREGKQSIVADYDKAALLPSGTEIEWKVQGAEDQLQGSVVGLGESGELLVRDPRGRPIRLFAEDVKVRAVPKASGGSPA